ncbi:MAG: VOC family protein, partial [Pseudomonadales bacterium]|nr:VOC family protein [Pseudomonadales bacterium]
MLAFYRDLLGLPLEATIPMPGGGTMNRLKAGDSIVKIIATEPEPPADAISGGIRAATGYRYWTLHITDLAAAVRKLEQAGIRIPVAPREIREGVSIAMVEDPDGNWVELLEQQ